MLPKALLLRYTRPTQNGFTVNFSGNFHLNYWTVHKILPLCVGEQENIDRRGHQQ
jgi:hypothetical protein